MNRFVYQTTDRDTVQAGIRIIEARTRAYQKIDEFMKQVDPGEVIIEGHPDWLLVPSGVDFDDASNRRPGWRHSHTIEAYVPNPRTEVGRDLLSKLEELEWSANPRDVGLISFRLASGLPDGDIYPHLRFADGKLFATYLYNPDDASDTTAKISDVWFKVDPAEYSAAVNAGNDARTVTDFGRLQARAHAQAKLSGFHDQEPRDDREALLARCTRLALIHSEVSEALEALRAGYPVNKNHHTDGKPEGVPSELADIVIRVLDFAGAEGIDLETAIIEKLDYNATRPYKHGKSI